MFCSTGFTKLTKTELVESADIFYSETHSKLKVQAHLLTNSMLKVFLTQYLDSSQYSDTNYDYNTFYYRKTINRCCSISSHISSHLSNYRVIFNEGSIVSGCI